LVWLTNFLAFEMAIRDLSSGSGGAVLWLRLAGCGSVNELGRIPGGFTCECGVARLPGCRLLGVDEAEEALSLICLIGASSCVFQ